VGALEWQSPFRGTQAAWKKMSRVQQQKLDVAVMRVLESQLRGQE